MGDLGGGVIVLGLGAIGGDRTGARTEDRDRARAAVDVADRWGRRVVADGVRVHAAAHRSDEEWSGVIRAGGVAS